MKIKQNLSLINLSKVFFIIFCSLFFLGQFQRLELLGLPAFYIHDVILGLWAGWIVITHQKQVVNFISKFRIKKYKVEFILVAWIILGWVVAWMVGGLDMRFVFYVLRFLTYSFIFFSINKFKLIKKEFLRSGYFLTGFGLLLGGFLQYLFVPDTRFLIIWGWDEHFYRLIGTQFDPNFMGILLVLLFINFYDFKFKSKFFWIKKRINLKYFLLFLLLVGISLSFSRASFLSFFVALVLRAGLKFKNYLWAILLLILIVFTPKPGGEGVDLMRTASITARITSSQKAVLNLNSYQYILGAGLFANDQNDLIPTDLTTPDHAYLSDNLILSIFNATGIVGLSLFLFLGAKCLRLLYFKNKVAFLSVVAVLVHSMFNNTLFQPFVFLYLIWGINSVSD